MSRRVDPDRWWDYSGPLCDCPGERAGQPYDDRFDPEPAYDRGSVWEDLTEEERELLKLRSQR